MALRPDHRLACETRGLGNPLHAGIGGPLPTGRSAPATRSDYVRTAIAQGRLIGDWSEPVPRGVVGRAAFASLRRQPLNAVAWLAFRTRLWSERSLGLMRPDEVYARWGRVPGRLAVLQPSRDQSPDP